MRLVRLIVFSAALLGLPSAAQDSEGDSWSVRVTLRDGWGLNESYLVDALGSVRARRGVESSCDGASPDDALVSIEEELLALMAEQPAAQGGSRCYDETNIFLSIDYRQADGAVHVLERHFSSIPRCRVQAVSEHEEKLAAQVVGVGRDLWANCTAADR